MHCNDPQSLASLLIAMLVIGAASIVLAVAAPAILARALDPRDARLATATPIAQGILYAIAAVFIFLFLIVGIAYAAGGIRICR